MKFNGTIIGLLLISLLLACNPKQKETITIIPESQKNHLQLEGVFGQVKTITIKKYYALDPNGEVVNDSALFVCSVRQAVRSAGAHASHLEENDFIHVF